MKKMFLENLPKTNIGGNKKGRLNIKWDKCCGYKVKFIYNNIEGYITIIDVNKSKNANILTVEYKNDLYTINSSGFLKCAIGNILKVNTHDFKININNVISNNNIDITIIKREYRGNKKYYKYKCNKCDFIGWNIEHKILNNNLNNCCEKHDFKLHNSIEYTHPYILKYLKNKSDKTNRYTKWTKIWVKCPDCGYEKEIYVNNLCRYGFSCPQCSDGISYPNKFMFNLLQQLNVDFISEYSPIYLGKKRSDFYIPSKKLIIEMDGRLGHEGGIVHSKSQKTIEKYIADDNWKTEQYLLHGIKTIRINAFESNSTFIKNNIIESELNDAFDLNNIDWIKIGQESEKSLVKEVCDYWKVHQNINRENLSAVDLENIFNISSSCIRTYLNKGNDLNWCIYEGKRENYNKSNKPVCIFTKYGEKLGEFKSTKDLERQSEELFGVKLLNSSISKSCLGKLKQYKGFIFKYV